MTSPNIAYCPCSKGYVLFKNTIPIEDFDQLNSACMATDDV